MWLHILKVVNDLKITCILTNGSSKCDNKVYCFGAMSSFIATIEWANLFIYFYLDFPLFFQTCPKEVGKHEVMF